MVAASGRFSRMARMHEKLRQQHVCVFSLSARLCIFSLERIMQGIFVK